jgi:hypothetical protein
MVWAAHAAEGAVLETTEPYGGGGVCLKLQVRDLCQQPVPVGLPRLGRAAPPLGRVFLRSPRGVCATTRTRVTLRKAPGITDAPAPSFASCSDAAAGLFCRSSSSDASSRRRSRSLHPCIAAVATPPFRSSGRSEQGRRRLRHRGLGLSAKLSVAWCSGQRIRSPGREADTRRSLRPRRGFRLGIKPRSLRVGKEAPEPRVLV